MNIRDRSILSKITEYVSEVLSYTQHMGLTVFSMDRKTINATAFVLGQIGELTKQISEETRNANPHIHWRGIQGLRNRIIHDYENLDMKMLWEVISDDLPELKKQIHELLR